MDSQKSSGTQRFLDMIALVETCIARPLEGIKRKQSRLKDMVTISFKKTKSKNNTIIVYYNAQLGVIFACIQ